MGNNCTKEFADGPLAYLTGTRGRATASFGCNCPDRKTCIHKTSGIPHSGAQPQLKCKCSVCISLLNGIDHTHMTSERAYHCEERQQHTVACPYHMKHVRRVHTYTKKRGIVITPCQCVCQCVVAPPVQKSNPTSVSDLTMLEQKQGEYSDNNSNSNNANTNTTNSNNAITTTSTTTNNTGEYEDDELLGDMDASSKREKQRRNRRAAEIMFATLSPYYGTATYVHVLLFQHHPTPHCAFYVPSQSIHHDIERHYGVLEHVHNAYTSESYDALRHAIDNQCTTSGSQLGDLMQLPCTCSPSIMLAQLQALQRFQSTQDSNAHNNYENSNSQIPSATTLSRQHSRSSSVAHARPKQDTFVTNEGDVHAYYELEQTPQGQPGSFGKVVKCKERLTGREFACKIISKMKFANKWDGQQQFTREIQIMQVQKHPHIIEFQAVFADSTFFYIIMEQCTGGEVMQFQGNGLNVLTEADASGMLRQMLLAVAYQHEQGVVHCDQKPDNFLLSRSGAKGTVKLIDFGLSKFVGYRDKFTTIAGTPYFLAPEVIQGDYSQPCDLWSLGVVLFIMLFGFPPFDKRTLPDGSSTDIQKEILRGFTPVVKAGRGAFFPSDIPVSAEARDLVARLLTINTASRLTTDEAQNHPWFRSKKKILVDPLVVKAMQGFNVKWRFQHALQFLFVDVLNDVSIQQQQSTFELLDVDKDGNVDVDDLKTVLRTFYHDHVTLEHEKEQIVLSEHEDHSSQITKEILENPAFTEREIDEILKKLDTDQDGLLKYDDLLLCLVNMTLCEKEERLVQAFSKLDVNQDGKVKVSYIVKSLLETKEYSEKEENIYQMLDELDIAPDGEVGFEDFLAIMWSKHQQQVEIERVKVKWKKDRKKQLRAGKRNISASPFKAPELEPQFSNQE